MSLSDPITDLPSALARIAELMVVIEKQAASIAELEEKLRQNSSNSSKPPSDDGPASKPARTPKKKSGRKPAGQPGQARARLAAGRAGSSPDRLYPERVRVLRQ